MQKLSTIVNKKPPNQATKRPLHNYYGGHPRKGDNKKYQKYFFKKSFMYCCQEYKTMPALWKTA